MSIDVFEADFVNPAHCAGIIDVLDSYASDAVGGGRPLRPDVRARLVEGSDPERPHLYGFSRCS